MSEAERLDAVVIGTGQAGKPLAHALAGAGLSTAIIERGRVGGTCIIDGCTPTKTMIASARVAHLARRGGDFGVETGRVEVDMDTVRKRKREIVDSWSQGNRKGLEEEENLELVFGEASFEAPHRIAVRSSDGAPRILDAEKVFVNTGARPRMPPIPGLDEVDVLDSTSVMEVGEVPRHLVIVGGGFIGLEFGQMFRRFGAEVTILERAPRLAGREDADVSEAYAEILEEDGIRLCLSVEVAGVESVSGGGVRVRYRNTGEGEGGEDEGVEGSHLLVAVGRVPNTDALNVEAAGLETDERGHLVVNDRLETNVEGIWALGDVNGGPPFTHVSYDDFRVVRDNVLRGRDASRAHRILTYTVFTDPQLGRVGLSEEEARERGYQVRVAKLPMTRVARALETDETRGFMKAVVDGETGRILGATVLGVDGGEVASLLKVAMMGELPYTALRDGVFSHPTLSESVNNLFMTMDG